MSSGLNNSKLGMEMFLNIVAEFKLFIAGGGSNQNLFSFLEGKTDRQVEIGEALLLNHERDKNAYEIEEIKRNIMFPLLDNSQFAYSIQDILNMKAFKSRSVTADSDIDFKKSATNLWTLYMKIHMEEICLEHKF